MLSAQDLHERGVQAINAGRVRVAGRFLRQALTRGPDPDLRARILVSLAYIEAETGNPGAALEVCADLLHQPGLKPLTTGIVASQRGLLQMRLGAVKDALASFAEAIDLLDGLPSERGRVHLNRGVVFLQQGAADAARRDFREALGQFRLANLEGELAKARHNYGYACFVLGDLLTALREIQAAAEYFATASPVLKAIAEQDRAEVLMAAGLVTEGRRALAEASATFARRRLSLRRGEAELALARTLTLADPAAALRAATQAEQAFRRTRSPAWLARAQGVALAARVELGARQPRLLVQGERLAEELSRQGVYWGAASIRLHTVRVLLRRRDHEEARRRLAAVRTDGTAPLAVRLLARDLGAELAIADDRPGRALTQIRRGLSELHSWQSSFGSLDLQTMVVGHGTRLAKRGLALAVESGRAATLFEWSERARMLASRVQPVRAPADEQIAADLAELRRLATPEDGVRVPQPRRAEELRARVRERAWQLRGSGEVAEPVTLRELRDRLDPGTALVAWVVTDTEVAGLVVTDRRATRHRLGSRAHLGRLLDGLGADLDVAGSELPAALAAVVRRQLAARLAALAGTLVAPLASRIGDRAVVLTPSGVLAAVPWTLLPGLVGRPVTVAQSATSWLARRQPAALLTAGLVAGPRVGRAEAEVADAARHWPVATVLTGGSATAGRVAALAGRADVLHVAAHGRHSADNPLFSGLELVGGPWFGYDIDQLERVPSVVLLSACEVGRSSVRAGEELIGMTTAWLHAGAGCVVASAAAVNDAAAHRVLTRVHAGLAAGRDPAAALADAVPAVDDGPPAPFVCFR